MLVTIVGWELKDTLEEAWICLQEAMHGSLKQSRTNRTGFKGSRSPTPLVTATTPMASTHPAMPIIILVHTSSVIQALLFIICVAIYYLRCILRGCRNPSLVCGGCRRRTLPEGCSWAEYTMTYTWTGSTRRECRGRRRRIWR